MATPRWDIKVEFLQGHLQRKAPQWYNGPLIRIGCNPGTGGMNLQGYTGIAEIHATIQVYDGVHIKISTNGSRTIRIATHENINWSQVDPLPQKAYLSPGDVVHLGSLDHGCRFRLIECRTFEWRQRNLASSANDLPEPIETHPSNVIDPSLPRWFRLSILFGTVSIITAIIFVLMGYLTPPQPAFGPIYQDIAQWKQAGGDHMFVRTDEDIPASLLKGFQVPFDEMIMLANEQQSGIALYGKPQVWDKKFYSYTIKMMQKLSRHHYFWKVIHRSRKDYATVVTKLREAGLPEVFAGIPMQETRYRAKAISPVCAAGIWQFMPETARRVNLAISGCTIRHRKTKWTPNSNYFSRKNAPYWPCKIKKCDVDDRFHVATSTKAATDLLREAWDHPVTKSSGSAVQMTIIAHNVGFNDSLNKTWTSGDVLPTFQEYKRRDPKRSGVRYYGDNILCNKFDKDPHHLKTMNDRCGGLLPNQPQHYGYNVVAKHFMAVCYFATNYPDDPVFESWQKYTQVGGYCSRLKTPQVKNLKVNK